MKPTYLKYKELYEYDGCASFVADYLAYEPLKIPNEMVRGLAVHKGVGLKDLTALLVML